MPTQNIVDKKIKKTDKKDEVLPSINTNLVISTNDKDEFVELRRALGSQEKASKVLDYHSQSVVSFIETGRNKEINPRTYTLLALVVDEHPRYRLRKKNTRNNKKDTKETFSNLVIRVPDKLGDMSHILLKTMKKYNLSYKQVANLMDCSESTIENYSKGLGSVSSRFYTVFLLMFSLHPHYKLHRKVNKET